MWLLFKGLALRFVVGRTLGGLMATLLVVLVPAAAVLKLVGLPILFVLGILGAPLLLLLGVIGLPVMLVVGIGAVLLAMLGVLLTLGVIAIKVVLPIVLIVWFLRWVWRAMRSSDGPTPGTATGAVD